MVTQARRRRAVRWPVLLVGALAAFGVVKLLGALPDLSNPFRVERVDRTQPSVLLALQELTEYRAARGQYQVVVDVEDDTRFVPDAIKGERVTFLASGTVDAAVDFRSLEEGALEVSPDGTAVTVTLPRAQLTPPLLDHERSYILDRDRGVLDRLGGLFSDNPTSEQALYVLGEARLSEAAQESDLVGEAERNTEDMLRAMLQGLGYDQVTVRFEDRLDP